METHTPELYTGSQRDRAVRRVLYIEALLNLFVAGMKIWYGYAFHILSVRADGFHSLTDMLNNAIALAGVWIASHPPDEEHPYGHYKFELFAAGIIGISLLVVAYDVVTDALARFHGKVGDLPEVSIATFGVLGLTLAINIFVAVWEHRKGRELGSQVLISDATHTKSDVLVTLGVMAAAVFVAAGYQLADLIAAGGVAVFIAYAGVDILRSNLRYLADTALIDPDVIKKIVIEVPGVASAHKVRTRGVPGSIYMDLHIQIAPHLNVTRAHVLTHDVIAAIKENVEGIADVTVHTEPAHPHQRYTPLPDEDLEFREPVG
ncbi:MAG: cation transporter [Chrysiogenetes bacterium]|nr:cation transporter [Chrysiogenetes bacterium]